MLTVHGQNRFYHYWLIACLISVFGMIVIGAITRLTESGLSITEWAPISGIIPPLNDADWQALFDGYRLSSQFQISNHYFNIDDFKNIFWWEYIHRFWGRMVGLIFGGGLVWVFIKRAAPKAHHKWLVLLLLLGGFQGFIGWWMVKSGLTHRTEVSQYRLMIHLLLALTILIIILRLICENAQWVRVRNFWTSNLLHFGFLIIASGALVAGLRGGMVYNEFPTMAGGIVPPDYWVYDNFWQNLGDNPIAAQFHHRMLAYILLIISLVNYWMRPRLVAGLLVLAVAVQIGLGALVLLSYVAIPLAVLHQANGVLVLCLLFLQALRRG